MIPAELLTLLRCPETGLSLSAASPAQLAQLNEARGAGTLRDRAGRLVNEPIAHGLVRADGAVLFPVRDGIPVLLPDEALPLGAG